jgi:hypothetical protein
MTRIIWPEYRLVSDEQMRAWYADAIANDTYEASDPCAIERGLCDPNEMARALDFAGVLTLAAQ